MTSTNGNNGNNDAVDAIPMHQQHLAALIEQKCRHLAQLKITESQQAQSKEKSVKAEVNSAMNAAHAPSSTRASQRQIFC